MALFPCDSTAFLFFYSLGAIAHTQLQCAYTETGVVEALNDRADVKDERTNVLCASVRLYCSLIASCDRRGMQIDQRKRERERAMSLS